MNEVSIIINGVKYEPIEDNGGCGNCDLEDSFCIYFNMCPLSNGYIFKKTEPKKGNSVKFLTKIIK